MDQPLCIEGLDRRDDTSHVKLNRSNHFAVFGRKVFDPRCATRLITATVAREIAEERDATDSEDDWYSGSDNEDAFIDEDDEEFEL